MQLGLYRSNPCRYRLRRVSVLWGTTWHTYLTNVLDPQMLSARQVCELYAHRWRIEQAFLLTKRLLGCRLPRGRRQQWRSDSTLCHLDFLRSVD